MTQPELLLQTRRFNVIQKYQATARGPLPRQVVEHRGAVVILPLARDGRVVLIRNYRIAVEETLIELPAGTLEEGEDPLANAHRELAEETGYRAGSMELLTHFYSSPGFLTERMVPLPGDGFGGGTDGVGAGRGDPEHARRLA